jgi:hypothetical protein
LGEAEWSSAGENTGVYEALSKTKLNNFEIGHSELVRDGTGALPSQVLSYKDDPS